jgi:hypothetical protein
MCIRDSPVFDHLAGSPGHNARLLPLLYQMVWAISTIYPEEYCNNRAAWRKNSQISHKMNECAKIKGRFCTIVG